MIDSLNGKATVIFGANSICKYIAAKSNTSWGVGTQLVEEMLELEEIIIQPLLKGSSINKVCKVVQSLRIKIYSLKIRLQPKLGQALESLETLNSSVPPVATPLVPLVLYPILTKAFESLKAAPFKSLTKGEVLSR